MHHVWTIAWRPARSCIQNSKTTTDLLGLRQAFSVLRFQTRDALPNARIISQPVKQKRSSNSFRPFSNTATFQFHQASPFQKQVPARAPSQLAFRRYDLRPYEVKVIFGPDGPSPPLANTLLKVLQSRRVNGTLDLELPLKLVRALKPYPDALDKGLQWLRMEYPIDEDAAIVRRIEREEAGQGSEELISRAENLGLYKPQSGLYGAKLGEEGDIMGESELQKIRRENERRELREQEELEEFIELQQQAREEKAGALEARREDELEVSTGSRPPNLYEKWKMKHYINATSKTTLDEAASMSKTRRLLPSLLFAAATTYACYLFALTWTPPDRSTRLFPLEPLPTATIIGILTLNLLVYALWHFPPAWSLLNRYFVTTPAVPRVLSHVGNIFSHQQGRHLLTNMFMLWFVGGYLVEQVGRGNFLGIYLASGVVGSVVSLTNVVMRGVLYSSSLGASGAIAGIAAAYCTINPDDRFTFFLCPPELAQYLSCSATTVLVVGVGFDLLCFLGVPFFLFRYISTVDHAAHLGGFAIGILAGEMWKRDQLGARVGPWRVWNSNDGKGREKKWWERLLGR